MATLIRPFQPADSSPLASLFFHTIHTVNARDYTPEQLAAWAPADRDLEAWARSFAGKTIFVAEAEGALTGFGELEPNGHIDRFYVAASSVGKGVGKKIYAELEACARADGLNRLFVEASLTAEPFFRARGFIHLRAQEVECRGVKLKNLVMEKSLVANPEARLYSTSKSK